MSFSTDSLQTKIKNLDQEDYGDFMRTASFYLNQFSDEIYFLKEPQVQTKLNQMRVYLVFFPNWQIEPTRRRLLKDLTFIEEILRGHKQDWESAS